MCQCGSLFPIAWHMFAVKTMMTYHELAQSVCIGNGYGCN